MVAHYGWDDLIFTHLSARIPGPEHHFLLNPYNLMFEEVTASSLVKVDVNGNPVEPTPFITNPAGFTIHSAIHMAREDAHAVMHLHTPAGQAVSAHSEGLLPLTQTAMLVRGDIAFHDYEGVAVDLGERERLVADLGDKNAMLLRNHGTLAVGKNVGECFVRLYFLERACQAQIMALSAGDEHQQPAAGLARDHRAAGPGRAAARRQPARLAGAQAQGVPPRPELRDLSWPKRAANVSDYRALAKARLPHFLFEYLDGGSYDEVTLRRNVEDLQIGRAEAARAARCFGDRPFDRAVRTSAGRCRSGSGRSACRASMRGAAKCRRRGRPRRRMCRSRCRRSAPARFAKSRRRATSPGSSSISSRTAASSPSMIETRQGGGLRRAAPDRRPRRARLALSRLRGRQAAGCGACAQLLARPGLAVGRRRPRPAASASAISSRSSASARR